MTDDKTGPDKETSSATAAKQNAKTRLGSSTKNAATKSGSSTGDTDWRGQRSAPTLDDKVVQAQARNAG